MRKSGFLSHRHCRRSISHWCALVAFAIQPLSHEFYYFKAQTICLAGRSAHQLPKKGRFREVPLEWIDARTFSEGSSSSAIWTSQRAGWSLTHGCVHVSHVVLIEGQEYFLGGSTRQIFTDAILLTGGIHNKLSMLVACINPYNDPTMHSKLETNSLGS